MAHCENCDIELTEENNSPSEVHSLCFTCWLSHKESENMRRYFDLRMDKDATLLSGRPKQ